MSTDDVRSVLYAPSFEDGFAAKRMARDPADGVATAVSTAAVYNVFEKEYSSSERGKAEATDGWRRFNVVRSAVDAVGFIIRDLADDRRLSTKPGVQLQKCREERGVHQSSDCKTAEVAFYKINSKVLRTAERFAWTELNDYALCLEKHRKPLSEAFKGGRPVSRVEDVFDVSKCKTEATRWSIATENFN